MANKKITELQLRGNVSDDLSFPSDDGLQSYRVTGSQIKNYVLADGSVTLDKLADAVKEFLVPTGTLLPYGGSSAPSGFLLCDGSEVSRTTYAALDAILGTTFGSYTNGSGGAGTTHFRLPDTRGIFLRGAGTQTISTINYSGTLGTKQADQMQGHIHTTSYAGVVVGDPGAATQSNINGGSAWYLKGSSTTGPQNDGSNGAPRSGTQTHPANLGINYMIKT